jgi:hypothetical protein
MRVMANVGRGEEIGKMGGDGEGSGGRKTGRSNGVNARRNLYVVSNW